MTGLVVRLGEYVERPGAMSREHEQSIVRENVKNKYVAVVVRCTYHPGLRGGAKCRGRRTCIAGMTRPAYKSKKKERLP